MDSFYAFLGKRNRLKIKLAVMEMWKPFRVSTQRHAPKAAILFDRFHVVKHLGDALDVIRRSEYKRVTGEHRGFIKRQRYVLLSRRENPSDDARKNLERPLQADGRLNIAYLLREQFEQLWDYADAADARRFLDAWREQLRDQDLEPYGKFAAMIDRNWDGIAAHSQPTHDIPLGFVEAFNNKIRVIQRRAYGLRDKEYLKLKILTSGLPEL
jgi:transposase